MFKFFKIRNFKNLIYLPRYIMDSKIGWMEKLEVVVLIVYILSPIDLIPEFLVGIGFADDLVILGILLQRISNKLEIYRLNQMNEGDHVIDGVSYQFKDDDNNEDDNNDD